MNRFQIFMMHLQRSQLELILIMRALQQVCICLKNNQSARLYKTISSFAQAPKSFEYCRHTSPTASEMKRPSSQDIRSWITLFFQARRTMQPPVAMWKYFIGSLAESFADSIYLVGKKRSKRKQWQRQDRSRAHSSSVRRSAEKFWDTELVFWTY